MRLPQRVSAGAIALASLTLFAIPVHAAPISVAGAHGNIQLPQHGNGLVHKTSGCHKNKAAHMVFKWGYNAWHRHGKNCQPKPANPPGYNPYSPPQGYPPPGFYPPQGYTPQPGYAYPPGYVPPQNYGVYACHRNWENHFHPGRGGGWHKHVGPNCKPRSGKKWKGGSKKNCVNILGVWICG